MYWTNIPPQSYPCPTKSTPTPSAPSKGPVQLPPVGHAQPPRGSLDTLLPSEARVSHRVPPTPAPNSTTIIPMPPHHPPPHHRPRARTQSSYPLWDMISLPGVLWIPCSHQKPGYPIEYPGVAGRREDREPPTRCVQVSGAEDPLCPASTHCHSWRVAHPAQDTSS